MDHVDALRMAFRIARHERPFTIEAIVILPEHLHAAWTRPSGDSDFSGRWRRIKANYTHRLVAIGVPVEHHRDGEYAVWQRRFGEHTIRNETDFERHVDYVHVNPVKHGLACRVSERPYSSFHVFVRHGLLPTDWAGDADESATGFGGRRG
jgi:putative transposase